MLFEYDKNIDIVLVLDATRGMDPIIDMIREGACSFYYKLEKACEANSVLGKVRVKIIWFRDFYYDENYAYGESEFFKFPEESIKLSEYLEGLYAAGGGDDPESGLEALAMAMRSDFDNDSVRKRDIIVLFTDAAAHPLEEFDELVAQAAKKGCKPSMYPENIPKDIGEFYNTWKGNAMNQDALNSDGETTKLDATGRRLILFAPNDYPWADMEVELNYTMRVDFERGYKLDLDEVCRVISYSI